VRLFVIRFLRRWIFGTHYASFELIGRAFLRRADWCLMRHFIRSGMMMAYDNSVVCGVVACICGMFVVDWFLLLFVVVVVVVDVVCV